MLWSKKLPPWCLAVLCGWALSGCSPAGMVAEEEKEPQFLIGRSRVNAMDYQGAIAAFEKALETNPRSAAAHFELGWLYAEKDAAPAAAIYHYEKFLQLRPGAPNAETIRQHIFRLKQELARGVLPIPPSTEIQRQLEQLVEENRRLRDELDRLRMLASTGPTNNRIATPPQTTLASVRSEERTASTAAAPAARPQASTGTHRVQAGETLMAIARQHNVKLESLVSANPGLNPHRLQIGQRLVIPGR